MSIPILGQPKKLDEFEPLCDPEVAEFTNMTSAMLGEFPLSQPLQLPLGTMCQIARTVLAQRALIQRLATVLEASGEAGESDEGEIIDAYEVIAADAKALLEKKPPSPIQTP